MLFTLIIYLLITTAQLNSGEFLSTAIIQLLGSHLWVYRLFWIIIAFGTTGVLNGMSLGQFNAVRHLIARDLIPGSKALNKTKLKDNIKGMIGMIIIYIFASLVLCVPAIIMDSDALIDAASNFPIILVFMMYIVVLFAHLINRLKIKKIQFKGRFKIIRYKEYKVSFNGIPTFMYYISTILAIIGIIITIVYQLFEPMVDITGPTSVQFGVFHRRSGNLPEIERLFTNWQFLLLEFSILFSIILICAGSYLYNKKAWIKLKKVII